MTHVLDAQGRIKQTSLSLMPGESLLFDPHDYGAIGDYSTHPLSDYFSTLPEAQAVYPHALSLADERDWCALQAAIDAAEAANGGTVLVNGRFYINRPLLLPRQNVHMVGDGPGFWATLPSRIKKTGHTVGTHPESYAMYEVDSIISIDHKTDSATPACNVNLRGFRMEGPSSTDRCAYGLFAPRIKLSELRDLEILYADFCYFSYYAWVMRFRNVFAQYCDAGFWIDRSNSWSTSHLFENCYVNHLDVVGYHFGRATYCTCIGCAVDGSEKVGIYDGAGSNTVFEDSTRDYGTSSPTDRVIINITDGSWGEVSSVATTDITSAALAHGTANTWGVGDRAKYVRFREGTHTGENAAAALTDASANPGFTDALIGQTIWNITDGSSGIITAVTSTTVTATLAGGAGNDWDTDDVWQINLEAVGYRAEYGSEVTVVGGSAESIGCKLQAGDGQGAMAEGGKIVYCGAGDAGVLGEAVDNGKLLIVGQHELDDEELKLLWQTADGVIEWVGDPATGYSKTNEGIQIEQDALLKRYISKIGSESTLCPYQGTHDTGNNVATLEDSTASFPTDSTLVGDELYNETDGSTGTITASTANTITAVLGGGAENDWDYVAPGPGDTYHVSSYFDVVSFSSSGGGAGSANRATCSGILTFSVSGRTTGGSQEFAAQSYFITIYSLSTNNMTSDIQQMGADNAYAANAITMTLREKSGASASSLTLEGLVTYDGMETDAEAFWSWDFTSHATLAANFITPANA